MIYFIIILLFHWFADFVCQTKWQQQNKYKNPLALLQHIATYMSIMFIGFSMLVGPWIAVSLVFWNGLSHLIIDYISSKITHRLYEKQQFHDFFVVIGFDQFLHTALILIILKLIL